MAEYVDICRVKMVKLQEKRLPYNCHLSAPSKVASLTRRIVDNDREEGLVFAMDTKNRPLGVRIVAVGETQLCLLSPREAVKFVLLLNASSMIFAHNHPSGNPNPSREDMTWTRKIKSVCSELNINFLDHVIVGAYSHYSFKEHDNGFPL
jgi:DNA repair protein RadC